MDTTMIAQETPAPSEPENSPVPPTDGKSAPLSRAERTAFLAEISHDIRTPLNAVIGYAELLEKTNLNERQRVYAGNIIKSGLALVDLLNTWIHRGADMEEAESPEEASFEEGPPFTMLVVDDSALIHDLFTDIFAQGPTRVLTAGNGDAALDIAAAQAPDIIFLDLNLPPGDGRQVARRLRDNAGTAHIPLIVMTGQVLQESDYAPLFDGFLQKPFQLKQLRGLVADWRERLAAGPVAPPVPMETDAPDRLLTLLSPYWDEILGRKLTAVIHTGSLRLARQLGETMTAAGTRHKCAAMREAGERLSDCAQIPDIAGLDAALRQLSSLLDHKPAVPSFQSQEASRP